MRSALRGPSAACVVAVAPLGAMAAVAYDFTCVQSSMSSANSRRGEAACYAVSVSVDPGVGAGAIPLQKDRHEEEGGRSAMQGLTFSQIPMDELFRGCS